MLSTLLHLSTITLNWQPHQVKSHGTARRVCLSMNDISALCFSAIALLPAVCLQDRRTYIVTNYTLPLERQEAAAQHNEVWEYYPDDRPLRTLFLQGDSRAALAPFLAHRHASQQTAMHVLDLKHACSCRRVCPHIYVHATDAVCFVR